MRALLFIFFILQFMMISCKKGESEDITDNNTTPTPTKKFSCYIDNVLWETDSTNNVYYLDTTLQERQLICNGHDNLHVLNISWIGTGSNTLAIPSGSMNFLDSAGIYFEQMVNGVMHDQYNTISGQMQFTAYDSIALKVSGTFNAVLVEQNFGETVVITNGSFKDLLFTVEYSQ